MGPVDIDEFMDDDKVQKIIGANKAKVNIMEDSDDYDELIPEDGKISGLASGKYYRVEVYNKDKEFVHHRFLQSNGKLDVNLYNIGLLTGNKIEGLTNSNWYKVKSAQPFGETATYEYFAFSNTTPAEAVAVVNGGITTLEVTITGDGKYYLDLASEIKADGYYEMRISSDDEKSYISAKYNNASTSINAINDSFYKPDITGRENGIYQHPNKTVSTNNGINLKDRSITDLSLMNGNVTSDYVFVEYDTVAINAVNKKVESFKVLRVELKYTPSLSDFNIENTSLTATYDGTSKAVTITPKDGKSTGTITVYYTGTNGTSYVKSDTPPTNAGTYTVTFDVAAATGWNAVTGLSAGTLTINKATPVKEDFEISGNKVSYDGTAKAVTVEKKDGITGMGIISTPKYKDNSDAIVSSPTVVGTYKVFIDVSAGENYSAINGLEVGTLTISLKPVPVADDFDISGLAPTYDGTPKSVTITPKDGKSNGTITIHYKSISPAYDSTEAPTNAGTYTVTFDVAAISTWGAATGLSAGELIIGKATPVVSNFEISGLTQNYDGDPKSVTITPKSTITGMGDVIVKYDGNASAPSAVGTYSVTFDVTGGDNYNSASGLIAGTLNILSSGGGSGGTFIVSLEWTDELKPTFTSNTAIYDESTGKLTINIEVDNTDNKFSSFEWYVDYNNTQLATSNPLNLILNLGTDNVSWFMPGKAFTFTLVVGKGFNKYSGKITFTPISD